MILPLKIALGVIVALLLALGGMTWYSDIVADERDEAVAKAAGLEVAIDLSEKQTKERQLISQRLGQILSQRQVWNQEAQLAANKLQEKIDALPTTCTFSSDASRVLWEIYEGAGGVQSPRRE